MKRIPLTLAVLIALLLGACVSEPAPTPTPEPTPADFTISDLSVYPAEIDVGEQILVSVLVTNAGDLAGNYQTTFSIDNVTVETVDIHLAGGDTEQVDFSVMVDYAPGTHSVDVNGLASAFTVKEPPASIHLLDLTGNSIAFAVAVEDDELSPSQIEYCVSGNGYSRVDALGNQPGSTIVIDDLQHDTAYTLEIRRTERDSVIDSIVFRTFKDMDNGLQLYYLIDARTPHDHILNVQVFGNMRDMSMISFEHRGYHFGVINIVEDSLKVNAADYHADEDNREVTIYSNGGQADFHISYQVDTSISDTESYPGGVQWHGWYSFLENDYLMTTGEVVMLLPPGYTGDSNEWWIYEYDTYEVYGYLHHPPHWELAVGFQVEDSLIDFLSHLPECKGLGIRAANIYAYDRHAFRMQTERIEGTNVNVILQDTIDDRYFVDIFSVYAKLCEIWGGGFGGDNYTIMIVDDAEHWIYAGEWTTGQGFSSLYVNHRILDGLLVHQMYHCWNAWKLGIDFCEEQEFTDNPGNLVRSFWEEGWNNFYCDKVLTELGFTDHDLMRGYYSMYATVRDTSQDVPMLEYRHGIDHIWIHEAKGPLLAYLLDQEIRTASNNMYSLDDVLKYEWERWSVGGEHSSYQIILDFIRNDLRVNTIDGWWERYIIANEPMYSEDFEFLTP